MALRRLSPRLKTGLAIAGAALGAAVFVTPIVGQQIPVRQTQGGGGGRSIQVPTVAVPSVAAPRVPVPGPITPVRPAAPAGSLTPQRAEAFVQAARLGLNYLPGEVIVKFKAGMGPANQNRALSVLGSQPSADTLEWHGEFAVARDQTQPNAYILADQLKAQPEVEYAEPNFIAKIDPLEQEYAATHPTPPPTLVRNPSRLGSRIAGVPTDTDYAAYQWNFSLINMPGAWDIQQGGSAEIVVAVIDTGITGVATTLTYPIWTGSSFQTLAMPTAVNPDLPASRHVLPRDYIGIFVNPAPPLVDLDGHGSHVSSTIGEATNNGLLVSGMAYNVKIMPIKVCAQYWDIMIARGLAGIAGFAPSSSIGCAFSDMADGVRYAADNGAKVMNISIGGTSPSTTMQSALTYAAGKGAFIALAMGNNFNLGNPTMYPSSYAAGIDGVMSVASIGVNQVKASYSSTGPYCEIAAPGGNQDLSRLDAGLIWQSTLRSADVTSSLTVPRFDRYDKQGNQGTSMASPHVAGLAALLMSQMPGITGAQVEKIIRATAKDIGSAGRDDSYGFGLIQPRAALFGQSLRSK